MATIGKIIREYIKKNEFDGTSTREIIREYIKKNGFDGLVNSEAECGCEIADLFPCESAAISACEAGYKTPCSCEKDCEWHIATKKPVKI